MLEKPGAQDLLAIARDTLLAEILPALPPEKAIAARMVAAAIGIALREAVSMPPSLAPRPLAQLAAAIRAGHCDPGTPQHAEIAAWLRDYARWRAAVSAPKALG